MSAGCRMPGDLRTLHRERGAYAAAQTKGEEREILQRKRKGAAAASLFYFRQLSQMRRHRRERGMEHMQFAYEARENTLIIHMPREIDHHSCRSMKRDTELLLGENYINRIVFDFTHTEFMDSSGVGVLLSCYKQMAASRGSTAYYGAGPQVQRILAIAGIERLMNGYAGKEEALRGGRE